MAQIAGAVTGLQVASIVDLDDKDDDDLDPIAQKLLDAYKHYQRGNVKAAAATAVGAVNMLASEFRLTCGAEI